MGPILYLPLWGHRQPYSSLQVAPGMSTSGTMNTSFSGLLAQVKESFRIISNTGSSPPFFMSRDIFRVSSSSTLSVVFLSSCTLSHKNTTASHEKLMVNTERNIQKSRQKIMNGVFRLINRLNPRRRRKRSHFPRNFLRILLRLRNRDLFQYVIDNGFGRNSGNYRFRMQNDPMFQYAGEKLDDVIGDNIISAFDKSPGAAGFHDGN